MAKPIPNFKSESGDSFYIAPESYDEEVKAYDAALNRGDEDAMLNFEEGNTGWIYIGD